MDGWMDGWMCYACAVLHRLPRSCVFWGCRKRFSFTFIHAAIYLGAMGYAVTSAIPFLHPSLHYSIAAAKPCVDGVAEMAGPSLLLLSLL